MMREQAKKAAEELVSRMTLEERAGQLRFDADAIERLGVPAYNWWNEALHGVARGGTATVFPQAIGMAAMFDDEFLEEIADAINNEANRGCTVLDGTGWYSKQSVKVLLVMCRRIESVTIYRIIKSIDPDAFITQANVNGVYGKGFDQMKLKIKSKPNK